jgi:ABC-type molybdenum transport system ATPase subunit/photorepair protein PhrA
MSSSEARLVRILQAVLSTKTRPRVIILEEPFTGLASGQRDAFRELLDSLPTMCKGAIVLVGTDPRLSSSGELLVSSAHIA